MALHKSKILLCTERNIFICYAMQTHCLHVMQWPLMVNWMARWSMETIKTNWDLLVLVPLSELLACVDVVEAVDVEVVLAVVVGGCRERDLVRNDARHRDEDQEAWILCAIFRPEKVICPINLSLIWLITTRCWNDGAIRWSFGKKDWTAEKF